MLGCVVVSTILDVQVQAELVGLVCVALTERPICVILNGTFEYMYAILWFIQITNSCIL